jgi:hypothetical protein
MSSTIEKRTYGFLAAGQHYWPAPIITSFLVFDSSAGTYCLDSPWLPFLWFCCLTSGECILPPPICLAVMRMLKEGSYFATCVVVLTCCSGAGTMGSFCCWFHRLQWSKRFSCFVDILRRLWRSQYRYTTHWQQINTTRYYWHNGGIWQPYCWRLLCYSMEVVWCWNGVLIIVICMSVRAIVRMCVCVHLEQNNFKYYSKKINFTDILLCVFIDVNNISVLFLFD